jgi:hypothetical protein
MWLGAISRTQMEQRARFPGGTPSIREDLCGDGVGICWAAGG